MEEKKKPGRPPRIEKKQLIIRYAGSKAILQTTDAKADVIEIMQNGFWVDGSLYVPAHKIDEIWVK